MKINLVESLRDEDTGVELNFEGKPLTLRVAINQACKGRRPNDLLDEDAVFERWSLRSRLRISDEVELSEDEVKLAKTVVIHCWPPDVAALCLMKLGAKPKK